MKVRIRIEQVDNGVVFRWEDLEEIEDPKNLVFTNAEKAESIGLEILDDVKFEMDRSCVNTIEMEINYKPINDEQQPSDEDMKEALQTEYEKGRADAFAQMQKEWSEEDEKIRQNLMSLLSDMRGHRIEESTYQKYYPWLKSLKERYFWKPRDDQMKALYSTAGIVGILTPTAVTLCSLYHDLKKLKGE